MAVLLKMKWTYCTFSNRYRLPPNKSTNHAAIHCTQNSKKKPQRLPTSPNCTTERSLNSEVPVGTLYNTVASTVHRFPFAPFPTRFSLTGSVCVSFSFDVIPAWLSRDDVIKPFWQIHSMSRAGRDTWRLRSDFSWFRKHSCSFS